MHRRAPYLALFGLVAAAELTDLERLAQLKAAAAAGANRPSPSQPPPPPPAMRVILDTDMGGGGCQDVDDVGFLSIANAMADNGEVEILAIVLDTLADAAVAAISVVQEYYGRQVPIGRYNTSLPALHLRDVHHYTSVLAEGWPHTVSARAELPDAVDVYREALAAQPDDSVVVVVVGPLTNIAELLRSPPDAHSPLGGVALVAAKVKLLAVMSGRFGGDYNGDGFVDPVGQWEECNMCECDGWRGGCVSTKSAQQAVPLLPGSLRVLYLGQEVGLQVMHGAALTTCASLDNPARAAYIDYLEGPYRDRFSWDPLALLVAVRGVGAVPGVAESPVRGAPLIHNVPAQGGPLHLNGKVGALMLGSSQLVGRRFRASAKRAAALRSPRRARMRWRAPMVRP